MPVKFQTSFLREGTSKDRPTTVACQRKEASAMFSRARAERVTFLVYKRDQKRTAWLYPLRPTASYGPATRADRVLILAPPGGL